MSHRGFGNAIPHDEDNNETDKQKYQVQPNGSLTIIFEPNQPTRSVFEIVSRPLDGRGIEKKGIV